MAKVNLFEDARVGRFTSKRTRKARVALEIAYREPQPPPRSLGPVRTQAYTLSLDEALGLATQLRAVVLKIQREKQQKQES